MILINLLPHREAAKKRRKELFYLALGISIGVGVAISGVIYLFYQSAIGMQRAKNDMLKGEISRLEVQIKDIANLQDEITALRARQQAVEDLQSDRNFSSILLSEIARKLPDGTYLSSLKQEGQGILISGIAQSNERVSELLRNISSSEWLGSPELLEISASSAAINAREPKKVFNFNMRIQIKKRSENTKSETSPQKATPTDKKPVGSL